MKHRSFVPTLAAALALTVCTLAPMAAKPSSFPKSVRNPPSRATTLARTATQVAAGLTTPSYSVSGLTAGATYFWQIVARVLDVELAPLVETAQLGDHVAPHHHCQGVDFQDAAPSAHPLPVPAPSPIETGGQRVIGPDGQPVPDDQEDAPPPPPRPLPALPPGMSMPPGFSEPPDGRGPKGTAVRPGGDLTSR